MDKQSNNLHIGYATETYRLSQLTGALPSLAGLLAFVAAAHHGSIDKAADQIDCGLVFDTLDLILAAAMDRETDLAALVDFLNVDCGINLHLSPNSTN